jgi:hypothetical protein
MLHNKSMKLLDKKDRNKLWEILEDSCRAEFSNPMMEWVDKNRKEWLERRRRLTESNLREKFGPCTYQWYGLHRYRNWMFSYEGQVLTVCSSGRGVIIEIDLPMDEVSFSDISLKFFLDLTDKLG